MAGVAVTADPDLLKGETEASSVQRRGGFHPRRHPHPHLPKRGSAVLHPMIGAHKREAACLQGGGAELPWETVLLQRMDSVIGVR